jgi:hypothetical protein
LTFSTHWNRRTSSRNTNSFIGEVGGRGKITSGDARKLQIPKVDVVYFDPPFFRRDKGAVQYFSSYRVPNSFLLQKEWREEHTVKEDLPVILERLCKSGKVILISTARNSQVQWAAELARHKATVKKYKLSYVMPSGLPGGRDSEQFQNLLFGKGLELGKQQNPYMRLPDEDRTHRYVVQEHFRGKSMHADFRIESADKEKLVGWTLNTLIADVIKEPVTTLAQAKALKSVSNSKVNYSKVNWETGAFKKRRKEGTEEHVDVEILSIPKEPEPRAWLDFEGVIEPGNVGATAQFPGVLRIVDKGVCEYGAQKSNFHEYFPRSNRNEGGLHYRIIFKHLRLPARDGQDERDVWLLIKPVNQTPYVISNRAVEEEWVPSRGFSCLPEVIRKQVPKEYRYWEAQDGRRATRDALVAAIKQGEVSLPGIQKAVVEEFEKHRFVPFNQWGGSSKYAAALAERLPEHKRYIRHREE